MKILLVISSFPPAYSYGGALKIAYEFSRQLVKDGHSVTVYTTDVHDSNSRLKFEENPIWMDGIEIYHFKNLSNELAHMNFPIAPSMVSTLKKNINKFDIIHAHEYRSFQAILVHHYAQKFGVPYVVQAHGAIPYLGQKNLLKIIFDKIWGYNILNDASKVIALTETESEQYMKMGASEDKIEIVPNCIDLSEYRNLPEKGEFRKKYEIKNDEKVILYLGRLNKIKGIDLLIKAFSEISKELINVKLVIVGPDDGFLDYLVELSNKLALNDKILFTGPLYNENKIEAYCDADVYVLPSIYETFPMTVLESMACGTPVVVTNNCGISEFVGEFGYVTNNDKFSLVNTIKKAILINNDSVEKGNTQLLKQKLDIKNVIKNLERLYEEISYY